MSKWVNSTRYVQEILNQDSSLYSFAPDIVILAVQTRDLAPELWSRYTELTATDVQEVVERVATDFDHWIKAFRSHSNAYLILHTLEAPHFPKPGNTRLAVLTEPSGGHSKNQR